MSATEQFVALATDGVDEAYRRRGLGLLRVHAKGQWPLFACYVALTIASDLAGLALPLTVGRAIDAAVRGQPNGNDVRTLAALLVVSIVGPATGTALLNRFATRVTVSVRAAFVAHALRLGIPGRRPFTDGELLNRLGADCAGPSTYPRMWMSVASNALGAVVSLAALALLDWTLVMAFLASVAVLVVAAASFRSALTEGQQDVQRHGDRMVSRYLDAWQGRRTIRACGTLGREVERVTVPLPDIVAAGKRILETMGRGALVLVVTFHVQVVAMLAVGAWLLSRGRIGPGGIMAAIQYAQLAFARAFAILDYGWFHLAINRVRAGRVLQVLETPEATPPFPDSSPLDPGGGLVELHSVSVDGVLDGCELSIPAGTTVAVVGRSGAGKSTIAALPGRLMDPDAGTILLDGRDVRTVANLADTVTYGFERPSPLGRTIHDTIALGTGATRDEVVAAARTAAADEFVAHLPLGYDTPLEQAPMSGGERQRLGLARAALRDVRLVVLDDATSSLDTATEARVLDSFTALAAGRTTLVVAHRASTAARADLVAWLVDGRIERLAPHAELWSDPGYRAAFGA